MTSAAPLSFSCPDGLTTITKNARGRERQFEWLGPDSSDADLCVVTSPRLRKDGKTERLLFGRWPSAYQYNTPAETADIRAAMTNLLRGVSPTAQFILRGRSGEQTVQQWSRRPAQVIPINGQKTSTIPFHVNFIYGGNSATYSTDLWFDTATNLFVRSRGSIERGPDYNWNMVSLTRHMPGAAPLDTKSADDAGVSELE